MATTPLSEMSSSPHTPFPISRAPLRKRWHSYIKLRKAQERVCAINSQYPRELVKSESEVLDDLRRVLKERHVLPFQDLIPEYFGMGLNYYGRRVEDYVFWNEWKREREKLDAAAGFEAKILRNKLQQNLLFSRQGLPIVRHLGVLAIQGNRPIIISPQNKISSLAENLGESGALFCKPIDGHGGYGCLKLEMSADGLKVNGAASHEAELIPRVHGYPLLLVEETLQQHEEVAAIHRTSINTLRLWTARGADGTPFFLQGIMRVGTNGSCTDNASQGGISVPIRGDGVLGRYGYQSYRLPMLPLLSHPNSGCVFEGRRIPFWKEALELISRGHACFSGKMHLIAWDIAVTPTGPVIIEANLRGGTTIMQACHGGWRDIAQHVLMPAVAALSR